MPIRRLRDQQVRQRLRGIAELLVGDTVYRDDDYTPGCRFACDAVRRVVRPCGWNSAWNRLVVFCHASQTQLTAARSRFASGIKPNTVDALPETRAVGVPPVVLARMLCC